MRTCRSRRGEAVTDCWSSKSCKLRNSWSLWAAVLSRRSLPGVVLVRRDTHGGDTYGGDTHGGGGGDTHDSVFELFGVGLWPHVCPVANDCSARVQEPTRQTLATVAIFRPA